MSEGFGQFSFFYFNFGIYICFSGGSFSFSFDLQTLLSALPRPVLTTPGLCKCGYCSMQDAVLLRCRSLLCGLIGRGRGGRGRADDAPAAVGRVRKVGTAAAPAARRSAARGVRFVDLLKEGVVSQEEYERLVEPIRARKRRAEQMAEREGRPPSVRTGAVHRWTPAALASYESSTMQGGESADIAPG